MGWMLCVYVFMHSSGSFKEEMLECFIPSSLGKAPSFPLSPPPPSRLSAWCSRGETASLSSLFGLAQKHPLCCSLRRLTSLCRDATAHSSSVDELLPPVPFVTAAAASSDAPTPKPRALLSDNKSNRRAEE